MSTRKQRQEADVASMRHIVAGLSHEEALLVHRALRAYAAVLEQVDHAVPSIENRELATQAEQLAERFVRANTARDWIEEKS